MIDSTGSLNWSGWEENVSARPNYAQAHWNFVHAGSDHGNVINDDAVWPGIGTGTNRTSDELIQDGTDAEINGSNQTYYTFWVEYYPGEASQPVSIIYNGHHYEPRPGDAVGGSVYWNQETGTGSDAAVFTLCDFTDPGVCGKLSQALPGGDVPGYHSEWIVERAEFQDSGGCYLPPLAWFGQIHVTDGYYGDNGKAEYPIGWTNRTEYYTNDEEGERLDTTGSLDSSGTAFTESWDSYGTKDYVTC